MAKRTPASILMALMLWLVIAAGIAAAVRFLVLPHYWEQGEKSLIRKTSSEGKYRAVVRIAADNFSGYCLLRTETMASSLARDGIRLSIEDDGADYNRRLKALASGNTEMAVFPVSSFIQCCVQQNRYPAAIVYIIDETKGADAIIAYKDAVPSLDALNSERARFVLTPESPSDFLARVVIASFHLPRLAADWMIAADGSADVAKRFRSQSPGSPLAFVMWEPDVTKTLEDPRAHVLIDSSKMQGYIVDVLVVRRDFLAANADIARAVVEAYARAAYENRSTMKQAVMADAARHNTRLTDAEAARIVNGIEWKNTLENYAHFGLQPGDHDYENIEDMILKITDVLVKTGALDSNPIEATVNSLYYDRLLAEMKAAAFHPGRALNVLSDAPVSDENLRRARRVKRLTDSEWQTLVNVGELRIPPIVFGRGTARLNVQSEHQLKTLANTMDSWPQYYLVVTGRVRASADDDAAIKLAHARADAIVQKLLEYGLAPERLRARAEVSASENIEAQSVVFVVTQQPY